MKTSATSSVPLEIWQPQNMLVFVSFYSPIILAAIFVFTSFLFQNFKGFIYLGFLIGVIMVRYFIYRFATGGKKDVYLPNDICKTISYGDYGNASFSSFVFAFTILYVIVPMFTSGGTANYPLFVSLLLYFFFDIGIKVYSKCIKSFADLFVNILAGALSAILLLVAIYAGNSENILFANETSGKDVCYAPSKQTFKCSVYKNGELISSSTTA
jgi:hypothetical protein